MSENKLVCCMVTLLVEFIDLTHARKLYRIKNLDSVKSSHHENKNFFSIALILYLYEIMDVYEMYCDNQFMMYVKQIITLYTLNVSYPSFPI